MDYRKIKKIIMKNTLYGHYCLVQFEYKGMDWSFMKLKCLWFSRLNERVLTIDTTVIHCGCQLNKGLIYHICHIHAKNECNTFTPNGHIMSEI